MLYFKKNKLNFLFLFLFLFLFSSNASANDGKLDLSLDPQSSTGSKMVYSMAIDANDKILIAGPFTTYTGVSRNGVARINSNGSLDTSFDPGTGANDYVYSVVLQPDGKILIGGSFTSYNGVSRNGIARLNSNGSLDTSFNPSALAGNLIYSIITQPDGKILVSGYPRFSNYTGIKLARLNANGTLDTEFNSKTEGNSTIGTIAIQPDGKILVGGYTSYNYATTIRIARLNSNGSLDTSFTPGTSTNLDFIRVSAIAVQPDGKILIGGHFNSYNGVSRNGIARLNSDGSLDTSFNPGSGLGGMGPYTGLYFTIVLQPDGKIVIGSGAFNSYNGTSRKNIARLNSNGSLDLSFDPGAGAGSSISGIGFQSDEKIITVGAFSHFNNYQRISIARLENSFSSIEPPTLSLGATPKNVNYDSPTSLSWTTTNATTCEASSIPNDITWNGIKGLSSVGHLTSKLKVNTTFTLTCTGTGGSITESVEVTVNPLAPVVNISASPNQIGEGESTTLTWTSTNATSCTASSSPNNTSWSGDKIINGNQTINNLTKTTTFSIQCTGPGGTASSSAPASTIVSVISPISVTLTASPTSVFSGGASQLSWTTTGSPTICNASGDWSGVKGTLNLQGGGSEIIPNIKESKSFTITCTKNGLITSATSLATVTVLAPLKVDLTATPNPLPKGGNVNLTWNGDNADSCVASSIPETTWKGNRLAIVGTETVNNLQQNTTFKITCTKNGVNESASVLVTLVEVPEITFTASPTSVVSGGSTTLTWSVTNNPDKCTASNGWGGDKAVSGSDTINDITQNTTFTLSCTKGGQNVVKSVSVTVTQQNLSLSNTRVIGGKTTLRWTAINMKNCVASTENPTSGLGWEGTKKSDPSPYTGQTANVLVTAEDTTDITLKNKYIIKCDSTVSAAKFKAILTLDVNDGSSSGNGVPTYQEN